MRRVNMILAAVLAFSTGLALSQVRSLNAQQEPPPECNRKACDVTYGVCFGTDVDVNCTGEDPCTGKICAIE